MSCCKSSNDSKNHNILSITKNEESYKDIKLLFGVEDSSFLGMKKVKFGLGEPVFLVGAESLSEFYLIST